jgi:hypothetical protein
MAEELIDKYVDRSAIADDTTFLKDQLKTVLDLFDKLNATRVSLDGSKSLKDITANTKEADKAIADLAAQNTKLQKSYDDLAKKVADAGNKGKKSNDDNKKSTDDLEKAKAKLAATETKQAKEIALVNQQRLEQNRNLKIQAELENAVGGSIEFARAKVKALTQERNVLNITTEAGKKKQAELNTEIDKYNDFIKKNVDELAKQKINIGNYAGSAKIIVDAFEKARQKVDALSKAGDPGSADLRAARNEFEALRQVVDGKEFLNYAAKVGDAQKEVKAFTRVLINLESNQQGDTEAAKELRARLAELTDQVHDTKDEIKALASDTRTFDLFAGAVNFAADAFQTFAGAAALSADSEQQAAEITKTLIAIQSVSNGVKGIANELTTHGTAANKLYAFAQKQVSLAMDETVAAGTRLKAALVTLGIGAIIIGIGLLIANFDKLKNAFSGLSESQRALNKINKDAIEGFVQERVQVESLVQQVQSEVTSKQRKKEIIKELNDLSPTYFSNLKSEKDLQDKLTESLAKYIKAIELKAKAKAAENALVEAEKPILERQIQLETELNDIRNKTFDEDPAKNEEKRNSYYKKLKQYVDSGKDPQLQYLESKAAPIRKIIANINNDLNDLGGDPNKALPEQFAATKKFYSDELQAQADAYQKLSEVDDQYLIGRLSARNTAYELQKQILSKQQATELQNLQNQINVEATKGIISDAKQQEFNQHRLDIENDFAEKRRGLERTLTTDILNIRQSSIAKQREQEQQDNEQFYKDQEDQLNKQTDAIQKTQGSRQESEAEGREAEIGALDKWYARRVLATREGSRARNKVVEQYEKERADIEFRYAIAELKNEIDTAKKIIQVNEIANKDVTEQKKNLAELEIQLSDLVTQHEIDNNNKAAKSQKEKLDAAAEALGKVKDTGDKVFDIVGNLIAANADKQKNAIQQQIDDLDIKKQKEIDAVNASIATEQEKANKIALINARADAQKNVLLQRQRQLDLQKARFDKAKAIFDIILNTAIAVVKALPNIPEAIGIGALGAAELAVAIAAPLPKYKDGRKGGKAEWAITGDGGVPEVAASPDLKQAFVTPAKDTVTWLPKNWKVFPDVETFNKTAMGMTMKPLPALPVVTQTNQNAGIVSEIRALKQVIKNKPVAHITGNHAGVTAILEYGADWIEYVDKNVNF